VCEVLAVSLSAFHVWQKRMRTQHELENDGRLIIYRVEDVVADLPRLLQQVQSLGAGVVDLQIESPSLQAIFIHRTGRELRD